MSKIELQDVIELPASVRYECVTITCDFVLETLRQLDASMPPDGGGGADPPRKQL